MKGRFTSGNQDRTGPGGRPWAGSRPRHFLAFALLLAVATCGPPSGPKAFAPQQIQGEDPPPGGVWVEELGMEAMFQRRGRRVAGGILGGRGEPIPTKLTRNEQIIHITLWAI